VLVASSDTARGLSRLWLIQSLQMALSCKATSMPLSMVACSQGSAGGQMRDWRYIHARHWNDPRRHHKADESSLG